MKRWWLFPAMPTIVVGLGLPSLAQASTHCTVAIIMTTLGTDGTPIDSAMLNWAKPENVGSEGGVSNVSGVPAGSINANRNTPPAGNMGGGRGGGGANGGTGGGTNGRPTPQSSVPSGGTGFPDDTVWWDDFDFGSIPVPSDMGDEPTAPPLPPTVVTDPPVNDDIYETELPPTTVVDEPMPPTMDTTGLADVPEPGTLTLLTLAAVGGLGYSRRRKRSG